MKKKIPPLSTGRPLISRAPELSTVTKRGGFHPHVRTILNPKFQYSTVNRF
ncbi:hypothetical protein O3M35_007320 [Rhynocoris fuscipes]|uniref:Uncharacterized protein n=1 Tax=Rhynocoris fuscipes TaxID=488301 RepID=A0AAW1DEB8_9HEMI